MTSTFDPMSAFVEAMAAFDKAEEECSPNVASIILDLEIADLFDALAGKGIAVLVSNQRAWCESVRVSDTDPRCVWTDDTGAEVALKAGVR
ncbi:hypothetical protein R2362_20100 [Mycobacteroides chelonae]|nr:hypothetical protein [Mycobacteroides chelonae]